MVTRNVTKNLAGMEDLQQIRGAHAQTRNKVETTIHGIDVPYAVNGIAELKALDASKYHHATVYSDNLTYVEYSFDPTATSGIVPNKAAVGFWVETARSSLVLRDTVTSTRYRLTVVSGTLTVTAV